MEESYLVSARKYRPSTFGSVVGQKALTATLKNSIATDRLAHAYLFCGSRGVGKTSCARIFAKTINCQHRTPDGDPCNECDSCRDFNEGRSLNIIELDAASNNGVEDIRNLVDQVQVPPTTGRYRVFIIDEVHMLSTAAFNAFLKTLEEPPSYVIFILATTEKHKIIPTILSRCQIYDFNRITIQDMIDHLQYVAGQEGITAETAALNVIARKADGAMRDALSIFDQVAASSRGTITYQSTIENLNVLDYEYYTRLVDAFLASNVQESLLIYKEIRDKGFDSQFFVNGLAGHFRDLMVAKDPQTICLLEASDDVRSTMAQQAKKCTPQFLYKAMELCNNADLNYRVATNKQFLVELTLIQLCQLLSPSPTNSGDGEGQLKKIAPVSAPSAAPVPQPQASTPVAKPAPPVAVNPQPSAAPTVAKEPISHAVHPAPAPKTFAKVAPLGSMRSISELNDISIHGNRKKTEQAEANQAGVKRNEPFTDEDFAKAWNEYAASIPTEKIVANAMITCKPKRVAEGHYSVRALSLLQQRQLEEARPAILRFIADKIKNDNLSLDVDIIESEDEAPPSTWRTAKVLDRMKTDNPYLDTFIAEFGLKPD